MVVFICGEPVLKHQPVPPSCFPGALKEALGLCPAHSGKVQLLGEGSGAGRGGLLPPLACEKEYGLGKMPWKWFSIRACGAGRGQGPAELWQECPLRNSLFLPAAPTSALGSRAQPALLLQGCCVLSPTNTAPSTGGKGSRHPHPSEDGEMERGQGGSWGSLRGGQRGMGGSQHSQQLPGCW